MVARLESMEQEYQDHRDHLQLSVKQEASTSAAMTAKNNKSSFHRAPHSPLKIHRDSHTITKSQHHKIASSSGVITEEAQDEKDESPTIIYTHDPKVIHIKPEDFKTLVQKLTGMPKPRGTALSNSLTKQDHNALSLLPKQNVAAFNLMGNNTTTTNKNNTNMNNNSNYYNYYYYKYNNSSDEKASTSANTDERYRGGVIGEPSVSMMPPLFELTTQDIASITDPSTSNPIPYEPFRYKFMNSLSLL